MTDKQAPYGYCPICGLAGKSRERRPNGYDTCKNGHKYLSAQSLNAAPTPPNTIDKAAYDGAREDLAIWKKRALEAENKVKIYDQRIVDIGAIAMNPVKVKQPPNTITITVDEYERLNRLVNIATKMKLAEKENDQKEWVVLHQSLYAEAIDKARSGT